MTTTLSAKSLEDLYARLSEAKGGETIELAGGEYGDLYIGNLSGYNVAFAENVTIISADPDDPAVFSGAKVVFAKNITFDNVVFDYTFAEGDLSWDRPFQFEQSENITVRNSVFDGDVAQGVSEADDGYGYTQGAYIRDVDGMTLENNEIYGFQRGLIARDSQNVEIKDNDFHSLRHDGMNFAAVQDVLIEGNTVRDFLGRPGWEDHRDMIQFWTRSTETRTENVIIRDNHLDIGEGSFTQSIFMRNEIVDMGDAGREMFYRNILIENNVIANEQYHGITVGETDGLTIRNNTVIHTGEQTNNGSIPRINVEKASTNVTIEANITAAVNGFAGQQDWAVNNNLLVQSKDPSADGYYGDIFLASSLEAQNSVHKPQLLAGSPMQELGAGADVTRASDDPGFHFSALPENQAIYSFEVNEGNAPEGTTYLWHFSDGIEMEGAIVERAFPNGGSYDAVLTIASPGEAPKIVQAQVDIAGSKILEMSDQGQFVVHDKGGEHVLESSALSPDGVLHLTESGLTAAIDLAHVKRLTSSDEFEISMTLQADGSGRDGHVFRLHESVTLSVNKGQLLFSVFSEDGTKHVIKSPTLSAQDPHDVSFLLKDGVVSMVVDDVRVAQVTLNGPLQHDIGHDLYFGTPWGQDNFGGSIADFSIEVQQEDFAFARQHFNEIHAPQRVAEVQLIESTMNGKAAGVECATDTSAISAGPETGTDLIGRYLNIESVDLSVEKTTMAIPKETIESILGAEEFVLSFDLTPEGAPDTGEVMRLHSSFMVNVSAGGELGFWAREEDGDIIQFATQGAGLNDNAKHEIDIALSNDVLSVSVDGIVVGEADMFGTLKSDTSHDLRVGNPWGQDNFSGKVSNLSVSDYDVVGPQEDDFMIL